jgi:hypothetical protein
MVAAALDQTKRKTGSFYVWMASACALVAFGAFAPTYWLQLPGRTFVGPPLLHIHAVLFSAWTLLLFSQAMLAANGRLDHHRAWGLVGISLATAMVFMGLAAAVHTLVYGLAAGYGDSVRAFFLLPVTAILMFAGFFIAAVANIKRPETHKRLVLLATISLLQAAMGRIAFLLINGSGPGQRPGLGPPASLAFAIGPSLVLELLIVAGMIYDWRTRGRPHRVWVIGSVLFAVVVVARAPISTSHAWLAIADAMAHVAS